MLRRDVMPQWLQLIVDALIVFTPVAVLLLLAIQTP
jgi:hypothetical protein